MSGVPGVLPHEETEFGVDVADGCGLVGVGFLCWPNMGIGLVVECGGGTGVVDVDAAALAARLDTSESGYDGKGPSEEAKSRVTITSNFDNIGSSTVNSHSR